jgi:dimethylhistidine N-methyltransferase
MAQPQLQPHPANGVVRFYDFLAEGNPFLDDVLRGLAQPQKSLPSKYLYDRRGCEMFEKLCALPEYGLARSELEILSAHAAAVAQFLGADCQLIEFGPGSDNGTRMLVQASAPPLQVLIHIDVDAMKATADSLAQRYPWLNLVGIRADCAKPLALPEFVGVPIRKKAVYFPGAILRHLTVEEAIAVLTLARRMVGAGGALLAGVDLKKDRALLDAACADAAGASAAFNLNLLARANRELRADFQLRRFRYRALYDEAQGRTETWLESVAEQIAHVGGRLLRFGQGEAIHTGISCIYGIEEFHAIAHRAGFEPDQNWTDAARLVSIQGMIAV